MGNDSPAQARIPHRRTGRPRGGKPGNLNAFKDGRNSAAALASRRAFNALMCEARRMLREAN
jgi:hypothetical protein